MSEKVWKILTLVFLIWAITATSLYVNEMIVGKSEQKEGVVSVNIGIKYGDGRVEWYNSTKVARGSTLLDATKEVAKVNYTVYPGMGAFVNSINGVRNEKPYFWMWWYWNPSMGWTLGPVAADKYVVSDGETLMWYYEDTSQYPPAKP